MRILFLLFLLIPSIVFASPPSRTYTYTDGEIIEPSEVTTNEDNIFNYLNRGVDTVANNAITTDNILDGTITNSDISGTAGITDTKLDNITTASKVNGTSLTGLASIPSGAGKIPAANLNLTGGSFALPSGAYFFIPTTSSCPTGSTDVTATYTDRFLKINATAASGGSSTISVSNMPAHTHNQTATNAGGSTAFGKGDGSTSPTTVESGYSGSGTAYWQPYYNCKMCQVD